MYALTFLGASKYSEVFYEFEGMKYKTNLFPIALFNFFKPKSMKVVVTNEAFEMHYGSLKDILQDKTEIQPIHIPYSKDKDDLWEMYDKIVASIPDKAHLIVDITHGFRAQPILALSICMYLRMVKNVEIDRIVYGAYEARKSENQEEVAPVWDLTPFLLLMDWNIALDKFIKSGNASELSALLKKSHRQAWKDATQKATDLPRKLQNLGERFNTLTNALATVRPLEIAENSDSIVRYIDAASEEIAKYARPFISHLENVKREYYMMAANRDEIYKKRGLQAQFDIIMWYYRKKYYQQAVTLAREWVISKMCLFWGKNPADFHAREEVTEALGIWFKKLRSCHDIEGETGKLPNQFIAELWSELINLRNDINHAGMRKNPMPAKAIAEKINKLIPKLEKFEYNAD